MHLIIGGFFRKNINLIILLFFIISSMSYSTKIIAQEPFDPLKWYYTETPDKMGRGTTKMANIQSLNTVDFNFPYGGEQRSTLRLRIHPTYGKDVMLFIQRGQFICSVFGGRIAARFDNGKIHYFGTTATDDLSTDTIFIKGYNKFIERLKKAKKLQIEANFYQEGPKVFEFDVSDLKWPGK